MIENRPWYTYRTAAQRTQRSITTIKRWRRHGLPMSYDTSGRRIVEHHTLLAWLRTTIERNDANRRNTPDTPITLEDLLDLP